MFYDPDLIIHSGVAHDDNPPGRGSGRWEYGTGENPYQRLNMEFLPFVRDLKAQGMSDKKIAEACSKHYETKITIDDMRSLYSIFKDADRMKRVRQVIQLHDVEGKGWTEIAEIMGEKNESSVRSLYDPERAKRASLTVEVAAQLRDYVDKVKYLDVGAGAELELGPNGGGITQTKLKAALKVLELEGYHLYKIKEHQLGTGYDTEYKVLATPETTWVDTAKNKDKIQAINVRRENVDGTTVLGMPPMKEIIDSSVDPKRIKVVYDEEGGTLKDGMMLIKRGVEDLSLGGNNYAQVRIPVDGTHYLKGMAVYADSDNFPPGVDILFHTNKHVGTPLMDKNDKDAPQVLKPMKTDQDNPFGSTVKKEDELKYAQRYYVDKNGETKLSAINIVNEEGTWDEWSKSLASQFLSKQPKGLAQRQLDLAYKDKKAEYDSIMECTNPTVKKILLEKFADGCDAASADLKAAPLPGQTTKLLLPVANIKDNEIYAPHLPNGTTVALIRYPHAGQFEIPILTVNNKNKEGRKYYGNLTDAVGIGAKAAQQLSGADYDGDTAVCIPLTEGVNIKNAPYPKALLEFNNKKYYKEINGKPIEISNQTKQAEMGKVTNLISIMNSKHAPMEEIIDAVKHSMVVIDAQKHHLDYKQSEIDHNIKALTKKYKASEDDLTFMIRAGKDIKIDKGKYAWKPDPETGEKIWISTPETYIDKKTGKEKKRYSDTKPIYQTSDATTLISKDNLKIEQIYANYSNQCKALANQARKEMLAIKENHKNPSAAAAYAEEVSSLKSQLNIALKNAPRERQANLIGNAIVRQKKAKNPDMSKEELKKIKGQAQGYARAIVGAKKRRVTFTDKQWEAIQAGAIGSTDLKKLINNADLDAVKKLATPRSELAVSPSVIANIKFYANLFETSANGTKRHKYTQAEIAKMLGISVSTVTKYAR